MNPIHINNRISVLPSSEVPVLSSDVVFIEVPGKTVIFDTGNSDEALEALEAIIGPRVFVISHFHKDHMGNLMRLTFRDSDMVYCGGLTAKKACSFLPMDKVIKINDITDIGDNITLYTIPSSHEKGCLALVADDIGFLGDAAYCAEKNGKPVYNVSLLSQTIRILKMLPVSNVYQSHATTGLEDKNAVTCRLENIYSLRLPGEPYIDVSGLDL